MRSVIEMNHKLLLSVLLGIAVLLAPGLNAQTTKKGGTNFTGTVLGTDGKPVAGAAVSCQSSGGLSPHAVRTDSKGKFTITGLRQDSYDLRAAAGGSYSDWQRNIPLRRGQSKSVTLRLNNGAAAPVPVKQQPQSLNTHPGQP
jgi:hypothetical protein